MLILFIILLLSSATIVNKRDANMSVNTQIKLVESTTADLRTWLYGLEGELDDDLQPALRTILLAELEEVRHEIIQRELDTELDLELSAPVELTVQEKYLALFAGR